MPLRFGHLSMVSLLIGVLLITIDICVTDALRDQRGLLISSSVIYGNLAK